MNNASNPIQKPPLGGLKGPLKIEMETCRPGGGEKPKAQKKDNSQNFINKMAQRHTARDEDKDQNNLDLIEDPNIKDSRLLREPEKDNH